MLELKQTSTEKVIPFLVLFRRPFHGEDGARAHIHTCIMKVQPKPGVIASDGSKTMAQETEEVQDLQQVLIQRPKRAKLTEEESLKRMESFPERRDKIVAAVRKSKNRSLPS